ncbi:NAD(P)/FAD-dependent oxidoreductase [Roseivirga sp. BDSF3-8]|uniref:NAD(P)/FAD-dependent oxidoreductase n=1 Tax=Roseivirga sp. BDSF3-8 TaxID=3241598 RepID=UPI003531B568
MPDYDVLIAGSGPAGCAAALRLHSLGRDVCIVDTPAPTRLKPGESLPGAVLRLLQTLGIPALEALMYPGTYEASTANAAAWGSDHYTQNDAIRNPEGGGWHILRHEFDNGLRKIVLSRGIPIIPGKAGKLSPGHDVHTLTIENPGQPPKHIRSRWLIDATGRAIAIARQFGATRQSLCEQMAAVCWFHSPHTDTDRRTLVKSAPTGWYYTALLPRGSQAQGLRVFAFHGLPHHVARLVRDPQAMAEQVNASRMLPYPISTADFVSSPSNPGPIATGASFGRLCLPPNTSEVADQEPLHRWLATGDAALSFDPLSSQGIFFALYSGIRAAEAIAQGTHQAMQAYHDKVSQVYEANRKSLKMLYTSELRYTQEAYWKGWFG